MSKFYTYRRPAKCALQALSAIVIFACAANAAPLPDDQLPSWNDGAAKQKIIKFVHDTTTDGPSFVPPKERIATFDEDGTLWVEQPMYAQVTFALDRVKAEAASHPEWKTTQPFADIISNEPHVTDHITAQSLMEIVGTTHSGMTLEAFRKTVKDWLATASHPRFKKPPTQLFYEPMLEVMKYLRAHGYQTYICTGGGQEFVRVFSDDVYGVPPEKVIGTAGQMKYGYGADGKPQLLKTPHLLLMDDKEGKPVGINLMIGRKPYAAFGNSTGDQEMLEWTQSGGGTRLMMLVHHDDAKREYAYGADSKVGTFSDALMDEANKRGWVVISMKNDWKRIFSW